ncbi:MAG: 16S rRNA (uracil(1498)-N(3))-methyltransferase [Schleiferiaceae bacterium]
MQLFLGHLEGNVIHLESGEAHHLFKVLRKSPGEMVHCIVNDGFFYEAKLLEVSKRGATAEVVSSWKDDTTPSYELNMYVAPTKNIDRMEWFLEKATEIGVSSITPILCDHSERKVIKPERLEKILLSATKQSLKATVPTLHTLTSFSEAISNTENGFLAHCEDREKTHLFKTKKPSGPWNIFIGPEGDFSSKEIEIAAANQFNFISLGESRLRTETAALFAVATVNLKEV